jgi:hypothetical protein
MDKLINEIDSLPYEVLTQEDRIARLEKFAKECCEFLRKQEVRIKQLEREARRKK